MDRFDVLIVGAGIVGLAAAYQIQRRWPGRSVAVLERHDGVGREQSGRNSGVIHSGIYYKPGSLKADTCRKGKALLEAYCARHAIPIKTRGKLILASHPRQTPTIDLLLKRAVANGVRAARLPPERIGEIEPHAKAVDALHVPDAGVVDFGRVCRTLARSFAHRGGTLVTDAAALRATEDEDHCVLTTSQGDIAASHLIACAGMDADRLARASGLSPRLRIVPFVGRYATLRPEAAHLCRTLIYPAPDTRFPFLGPHFTRRIDDTVEVGPTASPRLARTRGPGRRRDALGTLLYPGAWSLALRHPVVAGIELRRTLSTRAFARALRTLVPELTRADLLPAPPGRRAQALAPDGSLVDDFAIAETPRMIHVCNAPSPAATAALAIGDRIADLLGARIER